MRPVYTQGGQNDPELMATHSLLFYKQNFQKRQSLTISALNCHRQHTHSLAPVPVLVGILPSSFLVVQHH